MLEVVVIVGAMKVGDLFEIPCHLGIRFRNLPNLKVLAPIVIGKSRKE
jgi:hypothetical protein